MLHEVRRQSSAKIGSERSFGLVFAAVFLLVALWPLAGRASPRLWAFGVAAVFALCAWSAPRMLAPLNRACFRFGGLLHRIVSPVALGIVFFGAITPYALVMRLSGRDTLPPRCSKKIWVQPAAGDAGGALGAALAISYEEAFAPD